MRRSAAVIVVTTIAASVVLFAYIALTPIQAICDPTGDYNAISYSSTNHEILDNNFWMKIEKQRFSRIGVVIHNDSTSTAGTVLHNGSQLVFEGKIDWVKQNSVGLLHAKAGDWCEYIDWSDGTRWHRRES